MDCREWEAWYNRMPGTNDSRLHVAGKCTLESSSISISLAPGNEGVADEPDLFVLELSVDRPSAGDTQVVERDVSWVGDAGHSIERVRIQGEASAEVTVFDAT
jgi:hypothetical protein